MDIDVKEFGLKPEHGFSLMKGKYRGRKEDWLWFFFPAFSFVPVERLMPWAEGEGPTTQRPYNRHSFNVATEVIQVRCWWPEPNFRNFMSRLHKSGQDLETAFHGRRPPFTVWKLDELMKQDATYDDVMEEVARMHPVGDIRFDAMAFCGQDAMSDVQRGGFYDEMWADLEPPQKVKDARAETKLKEAIEVLGKERVLELAGKAD